MYKQVIVARKDLKMSRGKLSTQVAHASLSAAQKSDKKILRKWEEEGQKKVVLKANNLAEIMVIKRKCDKAGLCNAVISDAGLTELEAGTTTAIGIGPDTEKKIDKITGKLELF